MGADDGCNVVGIYVDGDAEGESLGLLVGEVEGI